MKHRIPHITQSTRSQSYILPWFWLGIRQDAIVTTPHADQICDSKEKQWFLRVSLSVLRFFYLCLHSYKPSRLVFIFHSVFAMNDKCFGIYSPIFFVQHHIGAELILIENDRKGRGKRESIAHAHIAPHVTCVIFSSIFCSRKIFLYVFDVMRNFSCSIGNYKIVARYTRHFILYSLHSFQSNWIKYINFSHAFWIWMRCVGFERQRTRNAFENVQNIQSCEWWMMNA